MERTERRQSVPSTMGKDKLDNEHEGSVVSSKRSQEEQEDMGSGCEDRSRELYEEQGYDHDDGGALLTC